MTQKWRALIVIGWALFFLLILEIATQVRSQLRFGQSVFNVLTSETTYALNPETGLNMLRPNSLIKGSNAVIQSNSLGLRNKEIPLKKTPGVLRIAILGASSVMGAYSATNNDTFPALLEEELKKKWPEKQVEVINAGIAGFDLQSQSSLLHKVISRLEPDLVIAYTGFNDFAGYCKRTEHRPDSQTFIAHGLPKVNLPSWLLSVDLLLKNTDALREVPTTKGQFVDPQSIDMSAYINNLEALASTARRHQIPLVMATNARAYLPGQTREMQEKLSATARYYNYCFNVDGLHQLYQMHNAEILKLNTGLPPIDLASIMPGGSRYFADASHFSIEGKRLVANTLANWLMKNSELFIQ